MDLYSGLKCIILAGNMEIINIIHWCMKSHIYDQAKYYEIAFSFVDPKKQGDLFEQFIKKIW